MKNDTPQNPSPESNDALVKQMCDANTTAQNLKNDGRITQKSETMSSTLDENGEPSLDHSYGDMSAGELQKCYEQIAKEALLRFLESSVTAMGEAAHWFESLIEDVKGEWHERNNLEEVDSSLKG